MVVHPRFAVSVCSGYGGIDLGLRLALGESCRTILYCEREAYAAAILAGQMEAGFLDKAPVWSDLRTLPAGEIIGRLDVDPAGVMLHGGIPCQPWSCAGKRRKAGDKRWLWPAVWRAVREHSLGWLFLENVRGFVSGSDSGLELVLRDLSRAGWDAEWDLFSAEECGAPHRRERFFLLAHAPGIGGGEAWTEQPGREGDAAFVGGGDVGDAERALGRPGCAAGRDMVGQGGVRSGRAEEAGGVADAGIALADRDGGERQRQPIPAGPGQEGEGASDAGSGGPYWPCRPGEKQYAWEAPRVVVHAKGARHQWRQGHALQGKAGAENANRASRRAKAEPGLGGAADGVAGGLDIALARVWSGRISALGNGVVPIVAAFAYHVLHGRLSLSE